MSARAPAANPCSDSVAGWLAGAPAQRRAVAFSGGADSTALLLAVHAFHTSQQADIGDHGGWVALHVHHGLQAAADGFEASARALCESRQIPFAASRVSAGHASGESPEDAARRARYAALADMARANGCTEVWLAQHAGDQAETVLLALSRGAGLPGLAAMPERFERHGMVFVRPLLAVDCASIRAWLLAAGESFVDDPSNADTRYTRNRIRHSLMPAWRAQFPSIEQTLARSARHAAQAQNLLEELAQMDLANTGIPPRLVALQALSRDRQANLIRHWLRSGWQAAPSEAQLAALLRQVAANTTRGHQIHLKVADGFVRREGATLVFER